MNKKIIICGATGFIGRNIAETLAKNDKFEIYGTYLNSKPFIDKNIKMIKADLTNKYDVNKIIKGMDIVIQAAATTSGVKDIINKPYYHVTDNAIMNSLIFRSAHEHKISHVIFFSCTVMYQSSNIPIKEIDFDANKNMHPCYLGSGWTKVYIEKMCEFYSKIGNTKYTVIRHSNIYGPYDKFDLEKSHVFGATITKVMTTKVMTTKVMTTKDKENIIVWGTGEEERDILYVSDLVNFVELIIEKQEHNFELYNVGYGSSISVDNLVRKIIKHSGKDIKIKYDISKPSINTKLCLDITKAKSLGWNPKVSLDNGIQKTMNWYNLQK